MFLGKAYENTEMFLGKTYENTEMFSLKLTFPENG